MGGEPVYMYSTCTVEPHIKDTFLVPFDTLLC